MPFLPINMEPIAIFRLFRVAVFSSNILSSPCIAYTYLYPMYQQARLRLLLFCNLILWGYTYEKVQSFVKMKGIGRKMFLILILF